MHCIVCEREIPDASSVAAISGSMTGDEVTDVYYLCPDCRVYTIVTWWDDFTGEESSRRSGPIAKDRGDARVALIQRCATSWDKSCRCEAHVKYFEGQLD